MELKLDDLDTKYFLHSQLDRKPLRVIYGFFYTNKTYTPNWQPIPELTELSVRSPDGQETYLLSDANIRELSFKQSLMNKGKMVSVSQLSLLYKRAGHLGIRVRRSQSYFWFFFALKFQKLLKNFLS